MGLLRNKWLWLSALGTLVSGGLLLVLVGYVGLVAYTGLVTGASVVGALLDVALPLILAAGFLVTLLGVSLVGLLWVLVRNASLPRSDRIAGLASWIEREYPPLRALGLADLLSPPEPSAEEQAEQALADLKRQYVEGEISEAEFERKVDRLVANDSIDEARAASERRQVIEDGSSRY